jgi:hypothetical protein
MRIQRLASLFVLVVTLTQPYRTAEAHVTITIQQEGSDVVATGSGTINLTDLQFDCRGFGAGAMYPEGGNLIEGPPSIDSPFTDDYTGITGPTTFGPGGPTYPTTGSGDAFGVIYKNGVLVLPQGYVSGAHLSATDTYFGQTFSSLGLTPGTYTWTWGTGANADSLTVQIGTAAAVVPEPSTAIVAAFGAPSTAIVAAFGAVALIACGCYRQRREQRRQAAASHPNRFRNQTTSSTARSDGPAPKVPRPLLVHRTQRRT